MPHNIAAFGRKAYAAGLQKDDTVSRDESVDAADKGIGEKSPEFLQIDFKLRSLQKR